ncbi:heme biosynthesis protein HemY [Algiphilus aromaticivorans]|uniref:heme biosynthesis protein HemY n=1 Tax=Algiphilus aromaticivorans TaxID=382454 RepID=UPI0005C133CB|nr:heme biosynthesis HemY N-terminal domain-containing protein [Algiphilus aromaticivorans]
MRALLLLLLLFAVGAASAYYLRADNGYVLVSYGQWMLETSVVGFLAALAALIVVVLVVLRLLGAGLRLPKSVRDALARRRDARRHRALARGLLQWLAGRAERAEVTLQKDLPDDFEAACHHLIAAQAAVDQGQASRAMHYLERAAAIDHPLAGEAVTLMQAARAESEEDLESARQALESLRQRNPSQPRVHPMLARVLLAQKQWRAAFDLLRGAEKARGWAEGEWAAATERALVGALTECERIDDARQLWAQAPTALQREPRCERCYAEALLRLNDEKTLMAVVHKALEQRWDPAMLGCFLRAELPDQVAALASVEQWLQRHGEQPELLLAAAHTCRRNRLWGKARSYLDALVAQAPSAEAHFEYGQLCAATKQPEEASRHFEAGLKRALEA